MIEEAGKLIKQGKIVIFPTETVYGIGTNGLDENAVKKLYEVKKRPLNKPISLLVSNGKSDSKRHNRKRIQNNEEFFSRTVNNNIEKERYCT